MNVKAEEPSFRFDSLKWVVVCLLIVAGVVGNSYFSEISLLYRVLAIVVLGVTAALVAIRTTKGFAFWSLMRESQTEIRKVVWPSRQETTQTTLIVVVVVLIMAVLLWMLDGLLGWLASLIIG